MNPSTPLNEPPSKRRRTIPWDPTKENVPPRPNLPTPQSTPGGPLLNIPFAPSTPTPVAHPGVPFAPLTPLATPFFQSAAPKKKQRPTYINGFLQDPNVKPSTKGVYTGGNWGRSKLAPFTFAQFAQLTSMASLEEREWNKLAREHGVLRQDSPSRISKSKRPTTSSVAIGTSAWYHQRDQASRWCGSCHCLPKEPASRW